MFHFNSKVQMDVLTTGWYLRFDKNTTKDEIRAWIDFSLGVEKWFDDAEKRCCMPEFIFDIPRDLHPCVVAYLHSKQPFYNASLQRLYNDYV